MSYINGNTKNKTFSKKPVDVQQLINEALFIIESFGIPLEKRSDRKLERMAMAFLAVADIKSLNEWQNAKDFNDNRSMKSRDIIEYWNEHFDENVSSGSYDDVRRQDLRDLVFADIIVKTKPEAATNNPSRGYALNPEHAKLVRKFGSEQWVDNIKIFMKNRATLREKLNQKRNIERVEIIIPNGSVIDFSAGKHNEVQKEIIEVFLPIFGYGAEVLYIGDTAKKHIVNEEDRLKELGFFELEHGELPDIVAYSQEKNWLFIIEAVYSCNPVTILRKLKIEELTKQCSADLVFVSAFPDIKTFTKFAPMIAWETEVWIASNPEHMIHFNGEKFLGSYNTKPT